MHCIFKQIPNISGSLWNPSFSGKGRRERERLFKGNELREKVKERESITRMTDHRNDID